MKTILYIFFLIAGTTLVGAQAYSGKGDQKFQVGANFQNNASGIVASFDYGLGENISVGATSAYLLGIANGVDNGAQERFDAKARFSAHLGSVIGVDDRFDLYPGLDLGLKNFGFHTGARFFFSEGFGIYTELGFPIASYKTGDLTPAEKLHNQFSVSMGATFNFL
ncbi:DUF6646 family protein [Pareuzebyella sediminis]|uniref:DUF6646 family protein n=1 Tax=Pareuzebyella sediminis TaxID=2607998 RepID=UPI0011EC93AD|nr:DUF6646 family protein [Pareuzebyella sediminis]